MMKKYLKHPIHFFSLGFGSGLLKPAPGTWGTFAGLMLAIFLWYLTASTYFFVCLTLISFLVGCYICQQTGEMLGKHDDGRIVWDEITAIFFIFIALPAYHWHYYLLTFFCFRFFDIIKPYPIRQIDERITGGLGVMLDDVLAAIYTLITLHLIHWGLSC